jgi:hypothetical protein
LDFSQEPAVSYIPAGCDQQGRRATGVWSAPHRTGPDFVDTTDLAPFEAAHAASEVEDAPRNAGVVPRGSSLLKLAVLLVAACALLVAVLA